MIRTTTSLLALCLAPVTAQDPAAPPPAPGLWSQWRGPDRTGHVRGAPWPARLQAENFTRQWRVAAGPSYSGPVVGPTLVFTTATEAEESEVVLALDRRTGEHLWKATWEGAMKVPFFAARNGSWIRSTPALDGASLFVAGMRDVLVCLAADTGAIRWRVDLGARFGSGTEAFGFVCSPLVDGDHVYVQCGAGVVKLDKRTGTTAWRTLKDPGGMFGGAFSSPVIATLAGRRQLVVQARTALHGVALEDGAELWSVPIQSFRGMNILTPVVHGDAVFTSAYGGRGHLFGIRAAEDGKLVAAQTWTSRAQAYMTSPVVIGGHAYLLLRSKRFCCVDLADGNVLWSSKSTGNTYWSLVANGDRMLALADDGQLQLIAADTKGLRVVDTIRVAEDESWAHLAVDGDQVLVRDLEGLTAFAWTAPAKAASGGDPGPVSAPAAR